MQYGLVALPRNTSSGCNNQTLVLATNPNLTRKSIFHMTRFRISALLRSLLAYILPARGLPTATKIHWKVTGTLFGHRHGHISFAVQPDPRSDPLVIIQLGVTTANLVREMASGTVRIALESDHARASHKRLFEEPLWSMYCNGRKCGYALSRTCTDSDLHVLRNIGSVSVGAGVIPVVGEGRKGVESEGELMYMRARFERVVGGHDSEALYMMNPDGNGGPELSIFFLRI